MDEAAIESKGIAPLKPQFDEIAAIADRHDLARVLGGRLRADVDPLNNTNFETSEPLRSLGHARPRRTRRTAFPTCFKAVSGCRTAITISPRLRTWSNCGNEYQAHIAAMFKLAGFDRPGRARRPRFRARNQNGGGACHARRIRGRASAWSPGSARNWPPKPPASTGRRCSMRPVCRTRLSS